MTSQSKFSKNKQIPYTTTQFQNQKSQKSDHPLSSSNQIHSEKILNQPESCRIGGDHNIIFDAQRAEMVCNKCGMVSSERMISIKFSGARSYTKQERDNRKTHGAPVNHLVPDLQMSTIIRKSEVKSPNLRKAIKWDTRYSWELRNLIRATSEIKRIGSHLNLPRHSMASAFKLYKQAYEHNLLKGRSIRAMVAASLYYVCIKENVPRLLQDIVQHTDITTHQVNKSFQSLIHELNLPSPQINPEVLLSRYVSTLELEQTVENYASKLLHLYERTFTLSGKDPKGLIAAALYLGAQYNETKQTQSQIAKVIGITEVTLRNRLREMQQMIRRYKARKAQEH